jgi:hypothetical protein
MAPFIQLLIFGVPVLLALVAYLLPGVRVMRSIAGSLCIIAAGFLVFFMLRMDMMEAMPLLGMVVLLSGLIIAVRPEQKPKRAETGLPARPGIMPQPYGQQGFPAQPQPQPYPQQPQQSPQQQQPPQQQPTPPQQQAQLQQNIQTPSVPQQPPQQPPAQQQPLAQQPGPGYPDSGG